jgi:hypothetical protein
LHTIPHEIPRPRNDADFERMCVQIYGVVFKDPLPKLNGRLGQAQGGVDIYISASKIVRIGIQCKKTKTLTLKGITQEIAKADEYSTPIQRFILATTADNDAGLLKEIQRISDEREVKGLFAVDIEFWQDICNRISQHTVLQDSYDPNATGAAFHRMEARLSSVNKLFVSTAGQRTASSIDLPTAKPDSTNTFISTQLDRTNVIIKTGKYTDALEHLSSIGNDLQPFDQHQKARWHLQRGLCLWFIKSDDPECAKLFIKAHQLYPDDDRMAAAQVRGLMLQNKIEEAMNAGKEALDRFPTSPHIWFVCTNVRMFQGQRISMNDVPDFLKLDPDALQLVAQAELAANNIPEAIRLSQLAVVQSGDGFFIRSIALLIAAEYGSRNPVGAMYGALANEERQALDFAVAQFEPRHSKLWPIQSDSVHLTAVNLGYALLMLQRFSDAHTLISETKSSNLRSSELLHIEVIALMELGKEPEVIALANFRLIEMSDEVLVVTGRVAAKSADFSLLEKLLARAESMPLAKLETVNLLKGLRWDALAKTGQIHIAIKEIIATDLRPESGLAASCFAARTLHLGGKALEAAAIVNLAKAFVAIQGSKNNKLMLAELLYFMRDWSAAADLFEALVNPGDLNELTNRLLSCLIQSQSRKRAKTILTRLPPEWIENNETLHLAIELGRQSSDWVFLRPLVDVKVRKEPLKANGWILKLMVSLNTATPLEFQNTLRTIPPILEGSIQSISQLANLELRYDEMASGIRRLYSLARCNLFEPEAISAYLLAIVGSGRQDLPLLNAPNPLVVTFGCCVKLQNEYGELNQLVIDPIDVGNLPKHDGFLAKGDPICSALLGAREGDKVNLPVQAFNETRQHTVVSIQSAYSRMLEIGHERANSVGGLPNMKVLRIGEAENIDLSPFKAELKKASESSKRIFESYSNGMITLGMLARFTGRTPIDIALGWPNDGTPLFVTNGNAQEQARGLALLEQTDANFVIDSATLAEFVRLDIENLLSSLPKIFISPVTRALIDHQLSAAQSDRSIGTAFEWEDQPRILQHNEIHHKNRIEFFKKLLAAADQYCEVKPAYSDFDKSDELQKLKEFLHQEELEVLMLAKAQNSSVLLIDGRLRSILQSMFDIDGAWPQLLLMQCQQKRLLHPDKFAAANAEQFLSNRSFIALLPLDLVWIVLQGGSYLQLGMQRFKRYLASEQADFKSTMTVALGFLSELSLREIQIGAFCEFFEHIVEAGSRHPDCPPTFISDLEKFVSALTEMNFENTHVYDVVNMLQRQHNSLLRQHLIGAVTQGQKTAAQPSILRPIRVRAIFCSENPTLVIHDAAINNDVPRLALNE